MSSHTPKYSPQYWEELISKSNNIYMDNIQKLSEYRHDAMILLEQKENLMNVALVLNQNELSSKDIIENSNKISELPGDYVPKMKEMLDQEDIKAQLTKTKNINSDYYDEINELLNEIDNVLNEYGEEVANIRQNAYGAGANANSLYQQYCRDYGMEVRYNTPCDISDGFFNTLILNELI